jgi:uncharacterized membrane protein
MQRDRQDNGQTSDTLLRVSALAGAAVALLFAARRQSPRVWTGAAALALPLATRGITGHWPLEETVKGSDPVEVRATFTIMRPAVDIYDRWRRLEDLPSILRHVKEVREGEDGRSHWRAGTPAGEVEWDAEIVEDRRPEVLRWQSLPGSEVAHEGRLTLRPWRGGEGTQMDVRIRVGRGSSHQAHRDGGTLQVVRQAVAALVRPALEQEVVEDIRRFKSLLEAGEIPTTEGQSSGERKGVDLPNPF